MAEPKTTNLGLNLSHPTSPDVRGEWPASMDENLQKIDAFAGEGGGGGDSLLQKATVTVSSAQIKALSGTDVELVAAPGTGKMIQVISLTGQYIAGATPYTVDGDAGLDFYYDVSGQSAGFINQGGFLDQAANRIALVGTPSPLTTAQDAFENSSITLTNQGGPDATDGDGTLVVTVWYVTVDL